MISIASFDVGVKNLAFCMEQRGRLVLLKKHELDKDNLHWSLIECLDRFKKYWDHCHVFLVEQQLGQNSTAIQLGNCILMYFKVQYANFKWARFFPASYKTSFFSFKSKTKSERKSFCIAKAKELYGEYLFKDAQKQDDLADALCQLYVFKALLGKLLNKENKKVLKKACIY